MRLRRLAVLAAALAAGVVLAGTSPSEARAFGLTTGFFGDPVLTGDSAATRAGWIPRAVAEGAGIVRVNVFWSRVAPPTRPAGFAPANPSSPGYDWTAVDAAIRDLSSHGLRILIDIYVAPTWAEGAGRPASAQSGTWRPDPAQFASFAAAAARRYDGQFPDPLRPGAFLPRVRSWQAWNEPNLDTYLAPQWTLARGRWAPASPAIYRQLLNVFYAAVKRVSSSNFVVAAGTAPYGDAPGGQRMPPVAFDRTLFCLKDNAGLTPASCPDPPHLDAVDHHPYGIGGPFWHAFNADDAAVPDIYKIARVLHAAERARHVLPRGPKRLWATEVSWDSSPPDPFGVPIAEQARWLEQALYVLWSQGVDTVLWYQIVDSPPIPSYATTYQAGLYYLDGSPKPAAQAFRFPFVTQRLNRRQVGAWGRAPVGGKLAIEVLRGRRWRVVRRLSVRVGQVFFPTLAIRGRAVFRARLGAQTSLTWTQAA
jgi:hypothetical protein